MNHYYYKTEVYNHYKQLDNEMSEKVSLLFKQVPSRKFSRFLDDSRKRLELIKKRYLT
jgi:hypothetical protein